MTGFASALPGNRRPNRFLHLGTVRFALAIAKGSRLNPSVAYTSSQSLTHCSTRPSTLCWFDINVYVQGL
jgi:hypothetical protein